MVVTEMTGVWKERQHTTFMMECANITTMALS